jgi:hypothetical protein
MIGRMNACLTTGMKLIGIAALCLMAAACGGGGGGSSSSTASTASTTTTTAAPALTNFATVVVDAGPAILNTGSNAYTADNSPFVTVTVCAPGSTTNCQTVDHVLLDTGSVGLRLYASVLSSTVLSGLTNETDNNGNPVGACYGYVDGYVFGSVRLADFTVGGEKVSNMAMQVIADSGVFRTVPRQCSSGGGTNLNTVQLLGANGVLGVGVTTTDCGSACTGTGTSGTAIYFSCPSTSCNTVVGRAANTSAPFQQLPNPVAAMTTDNNGTILSLPAATGTGLPSLTGTVYFGIGTQTNNGLGSATVLTTSGSGGSGAGLLTISYNGANLTQSFLDSGSNGYFFVDKTIAACTSQDFIGYYCPAKDTPLSPTVKGNNGASASAAFTLLNAQNILGQASFSALPGVGGNPAVFAATTYIPNSFDLGLPFFFGRNIYTAIEGRNAGGTNGPYFAY